MRLLGAGATLLTAALTLSLALTASNAWAQAAAPSVGNLFIEAFEKKDEKKMRELIKTRAAEFPPEVKEMVEYASAPGTAPQEQDFLFNVAGIIAKMYADETKDERLLNAVRLNYSKVMESRKKHQPGGGAAGGHAVSEETIAKVKKELAELGKGDWRVNIFDISPEGKLTVEIDVRETSGGEGMTPKISIATSNKAKEEIIKHLPSVKSGSISWLSMGVALRTVFIE
jgi:hypothetical protein